MVRAWHFICRVAVYAFLAGRLYEVKSWIYRWTFERRYLAYPVTVYSSIESLAFFMRGLTWTADSWKEMWDAISYPEKVEYIGRQGDKKVGDCDEFAIYIANAVLKSLEFGHMPDIANPQLLSITWAVGWELGGHNVCLLEFPSNGLDRRFAYMDYGMPIYASSKQEVVKKVLSRYAKLSTCLGWCLSNPVSLKPLETHWDV